MLRAFEAIGRLRGIRRAAESLGTSHAVVSRHLRNLELQVGTALFDRDASCLTETGAILHGRIAAALNEIAAAFQATRSTGEARLRIICAHGLALHWLTARISRFRGPRGSSVMVDLLTSDTAPNFALGEADGDIRYLTNQALPLSDPGARRLALASPPVFPVAAPDLAKRFTGQLRSAADLIQMPLIEERDHSEWTQWFEAQGLIVSNSARTARYGHAQLALAAARAGQGVALGNPFLINDDLTNGHLVRLVPRDHPFREVSLGAYVFRSGKARWDDPAVARFRRWLAHEFESTTGSSS